MADWKKIYDIISGGMDLERNEKLENEAVKAVIEAIKQNAGPDPQEQAQTLENALYGMADGFFQERVKRREAETALDNLVGYFKKAWAEYNSPDHNRWEQRAKAFFSCMGLTTGKRKKKTNKKWLFYEYIHLVHGELDMDTFEMKKPTGRWEALEILAERHNLASTESVLEQIRGHVRERSKENPEYCSPGFLPGRKPSDLK